MSLCVNSIYAVLTVPAETSLPSHSDTQLLRIGNSALKRSWVVPLFFVLLLIIGTIAARGYGFSWDEPVMRDLGHEAIEFIKGNASWPKDPGRRHHGASIEIILASAERISKQTDSQSVILLRHTLAFYLFVIGVFFFYRLATRHFRDWRLGLLASVMLVLSPRIFAHSFFNTRDIPSLSLSIVSAYTLFLVLEKRTLSRLLLHAFTCAFLTSIRLPGLFQPALTVLFILLYAFWDRDAKRNSLLTLVGQIGFYLIAFALFLYVLWPLLWEHPIQGVIDAWNYMTARSGGSFYLGKNINATPWHFIPLWILISTPWVFTLFFLIGGGAFFRKFFMNPLHPSTEERHELYFFLWFIFPIVAVAIVGTQLFDDWRHVFFIFPAFIIFSIHGFRWSINAFSNLQKPLHRSIPAFLLVISLFLTGSWMIRAHPFQSVYFSVPSSFAWGNFELDYWGLSFRSALEYILEFDTRPKIKIHPTASPGFNSRFILTPEQRERIQFVHPQDADYILDNFRSNAYIKIIPDEMKIHSISANGLEILGIYRANPSRTASSGAMLTF